MKKYSVLGVQPLQTKIFSGFWHGGNTANIHEFWQFLKHSAFILITWHLGSWNKMNLQKNQIFKASMLSHTRKSLVIQQQQKHCEVHNRIIRNAITDEWVIHCLREIICRASLVRTMSSCTNCARSFSLLNREKACAKCGFAFCSKCLLSYNGSKVRLRNLFQNVISTLAE